MPTIAEKVVYIPKCLICGIADATWGVWLYGTDGPYCEGCADDRVQEINRELLEKGSG